MDRFRLLIILMGIVAALALGVPGLPAGPRVLAQNPGPPANATCLACHGQAGLTMKLPGSEQVPLFVDAANYGHSVHGEGFACTNCHEQITGFPHPEVTAQNTREYTLTHSGSCQKCHSSEYSHTRDSVHTKLLGEGNGETPVCSDCHGSHYIQSKHSKVDISRTCSRCHSQVYDKYVGSVHGKALTVDGVSDVPVCTDCHKSHDIGDPRTLTFHYQSVDICANCHTRPEVVAKYGLSPYVVQTYLQDFHGAAVTFRTKELQSETPGYPETFVPVCTDCHGVHDILAVKDPASPVFKGNLVKTCRKCHENASENFPAAWLSHYQPSWDQARLIYVIRSFYRVFIPFVIIGLVLHIAIDFWKAGRKR